MRSIRTLEDRNLLSTNEEMEDLIFVIVSIPYTKKVMNQAQNSEALHIQCVIVDWNESLLDSQTATYVINMIA